MNTDFIKGYFINTILWEINMNTRNYVFYDKRIVFGVVGAFEAFGYALDPIVSAYIYGLNKSLLFLGLLLVSILVSVIDLILCKKVYNIK